MDGWLDFKGMNKFCMFLSLADTILPFLYPVSISKYSSERYETFCSVCFCWSLLCSPITLPVLKKKFWWCVCGGFELI